jgi:hypothetical protein
MIDAMDSSPEREDMVETEKSDQSQQELISSHANGSDIATSTLENYHTFRADQRFVWIVLNELRLSEVGFCSPIIHLNLS